MILDTNCISALLDGEESLEDTLGLDDQHSVPTIVIGEYVFGLFGSRYKLRLFAALADFLDAATILAVTTETAWHYAEIRHELKLRGTPIPLNDLWIAALARQHAMPIASRDAHFDHVAGITRVGW
ncbi:tRNA(fMet)-specific endonuclease VapC [Pirellulimonas nuda]|uniref:Ribonuclease VapC n=1 Tax=Pirellulimonas nuda TaxID=2528009 RepID=A0A518D8A4_9BACT|nr:PIN domain-containing protein [Pirellulimonas nuda]QDU87698.1 tRNA(fMet)-specific endonuclease VapC [Pirellulimonas nuda]